MDHCDQCGFVYSDIATDRIPTYLASFGSRYRTRLVPTPSAGQQHHEDLRARPQPDVWSAIEYACHVRDVLEVQRQRLQLALSEDCPRFAPMGRDERAVTDSYNDQDPLVVAAAIDERCALIAATCARLTAAQWERTGIYSWPHEAERSMAWLGRHTIHEGEHHLADIDRVLGRS